MQPLYIEDRTRPYSCMAGRQLNKSEYKMNPASKRRSFEARTMELGRISLVISIFACMRSAQAAAEQRLLNGPLFLGGTGGWSSRPKSILHESWGRTKVGERLTHLLHKVSILEMGGFTSE